MAILNDEYSPEEITERAFYGGSVFTAVDRILAVRDEEMAALRQRAEQAEADRFRLQRDVDSAVATQEEWRRLWQRADAERSAEAVRAEQAEAAVARVRSRHRAVKRAGETICDACSPKAGDGPRRYVVEPWPCDTIRDLDYPATPEADHG
ncbi:hypothetical protein [Sphaerisporangium sp. TRM90804]|uniref:hypothetical protein n=1 Tax=Sphaerisporangium sp. TRM90804 TaxID=3031113 RepID=UPI00244B551E|nr:hypothetical protein [Sphaerisporangium sp. TRM90804]MDH2424799.1 hypothetical protein [Sphaerisporangium sp. TRM90804]